MTRPDEVSSRFEEIVVVYEEIVGCALRRDLLAAQCQMEVTQAPIDAQLH